MIAVTKGCSDAADTSDRTRIRQRPNPFGSRTSTAMPTCAGMAQAMALVLRVLAVEGIDILAVEDPGAGRFTSEQAAASEIALAPIAVDGDGLDVAVLERTAARVLYWSPQPLSGQQGWFSPGTDANS